MPSKKAAGTGNNTAKLLHKYRAALHKFQSIIKILPAARGLFTMLSRALWATPSQVILLSAHKEVCAALLGFFIHQV